MNFKMWKKRNGSIQFHSHYLLFPPQSKSLTNVLFLLDVPFETCLKLNRAMPLFVGKGIVWIFLEMLL